MLKRVVLGALTAMALAGPAGAGSDPLMFWRPQEIGGSDTAEVAAYTLASAEQVITLVRSVRDIEFALDGGGSITRESDLRVSLIVLDLGPSTDVSPTLELHLGMWNDINETGVAWAIVPIVQAWGFHGVERTAPGIYELEVTTADGTGDAACFFELTRIVIDARQLSVDVRRAPGMGEFEDRRYRTPVVLSSERLGCPG